MLIRSRAMVHLQEQPIDIGWIDLHYSFPCYLIRVVKACSLHIMTLNFRDNYINPKGLKLKAVAKEVPLLSEKMGYDVNTCCGVVVESSDIADGSDGRRGGSCPVEPTI